MPSVEYTAAKGLVQKSSDSAILDLRGALSGFRKKIVAVTADVTLTNNDSGSVFLATAAADLEITLPADPETGTKYRVIAAANVGAGVDIEVVQGNAAHDFVGTLLRGGANVDAPLVADTRVQFVAEKAKAGDFIELFYTGSLWSVYGVSQDVAGIKFHPAA